MDPPGYTPSVSHFSLVFASDVNSATSFSPMLLEINSTRLNLYQINPLHSSFIAHHFNGLSTEYCDPELVHKSKKTASSAEVKKLVQKRGSPMSLTRLFMKLSTSASTSTKKTSTLQQETKGFVNYANLRLSGMESMERASIDILHLLNYKPDLNHLFKQEGDNNESYIAELKSMTTNLFKSWSLQELLYFGNAVDIYQKPFMLRLAFPEGQYLINTFNGYDLVSIFYKLNIARELSFDIDLRCLEPLDYCLPRRRHRTRRNTGSRQRHRSNTVTSVSSIEDEEEDPIESAPPPPYTLSPVPEENALSIPNSESSTSIARTNSLFSTVDQMTRVSSIDSSLSLASFTQFRNHHNHYNTSITSFEKVPIEWGILNTTSNYDNLIFALKCVKACHPKKTWVV